MLAPSVLTRDQWRAQGGPEYVRIWRWRQQQLTLMKDDPSLMYGCLQYYKDKPKEWICAWFDTYDPRHAKANVKSDLPPYLPFILFERQAQMVDFILECMEDEECGIVDKSREMGATWIGVALSIWLWIYYPGASIGWGSAKILKVDKIGDPDSIFEKIRLAIRRLPRFFWPRGFDPDEHMSFMKITNPANEATITGDGGDNIGRGGRKLIYFVDEASHLEQAESVEAALMETSRVRIDISTTNGVATVFDRKREAGEIWEPGQPKIPPGKLRVFVMDWSDHPQKDDQWHARREQTMKDSGLLAKFRQEIDRDPTSSIEGIICPQEWVRAAVDAHVKLKIPMDGRDSAALDVADEGGDLNALTIRKGIVLNYADDWGEGDPGATTRRSIAIVRTRLPCDVQYDSVGVGAGVKSEANRLKLDNLLPKGLMFVSWNAGAGVLHAEERVIRGDNQSPLIKDFYANLKAQAWWALRRRFELTFRAITEKDFKYNPADLISLDSRIPKLRKLMRELSQAVMTHDGKLRLMVDKKPDGASSPNLADSVVMNYFPLTGGLRISPQALEASRHLGMRR